MRLFACLLLACLLAGAVGCVQPPGGPAVQPGWPGDKRTSWQTDLPTGPAVLDWIPATGRASEDLQTRHQLAETEERIVLREEFEQVKATEVAGWQIIGFPSIRPITLDGATGLELRAPADVREPCGLEQILRSDMVAGRDVRVDVRLTCRSFIRTEAMQKTRISLIGKDRAGRTDEVVLPLEIGVSPGWEWQRFRVRFAPDVADVRFRIIAAAAGGSITLDAIRITAGPVLGALTGESRAGEGNLVPDGDFETGATHFFASATTRWPNGDERVVPLSWQITNDPSVGGHSLAVFLSQPIGRIGFGPLDLSRLPAGANNRLFLSFMARAFRPSIAAVTLRTRSRSLGRVTFPLTAAWQRFTGGFDVQAETFEQRVDLAGAELVFEFTGDDVPEPNVCSLDAVVLQTSPIMSRYASSSPTEIGLAAPAHDSTEMWNLFDLQERVSFGLRLVGEPTSTPTTQSAQAVAARPAGQLAIDLVDAWDRTAARQTRKISVPSGLTRAEWIELGVLPRGYYRVLATLWEGEPGESKLIGQTSMPLAVISLRDPVPAMGLFGLSAREGNVSTRTTPLGSSWVRAELSPRRCRSSAGQWDFSVWHGILGQCERAHVDLVADVELPATADLRRSFVDNWLAEPSTSPIGIIIRVPAIGRQSGQDYLQQLEEVRTLIGPRIPTLRAVQDLSFLEGLPDQTTPADGQTVPIVWGLSGRESPLPENREAYLEAIGRRRPANTEVWELGAPVRLGTNPTLGIRRLPVQSGNGRGGPIVLLEAPVDPIRAASRMVRSILIRTLAGANMVCSEATALAPPRSIHDEDHTWLHEPNLGPRAAVVALDLAAELLNNASPTRWIDLPGGGRVLYFEKDDGRAVAVLWRPYGLAPTRVSLPTLPASTTVLDCMGGPKTVAQVADRRVFEVNEFVQYVLVPADQRETLRRALDKIEVVAGQPHTGEPAASMPAGRSIR